MYGYSSLIDWDEFTQEERDFIQDLPHGAGIDCDWYCEKDGDHIVCYNSYHGMDEGMYIMYIEFEVRFNLKRRTMDVRLQDDLNETGKYWAERWGLEDYLGDTLWPW